jgi:phosphoglycerate dehydrogenase-like enzyme
LIERYSLRESESPVRERPNWRRPTKIVTLYGEEVAIPFRAISPDTVVVGVNVYEEAAAEIADADVFFTDWCTEDIIANGVNLRWVHTWAAGVDSCVSRPEFVKRNILLTNTQRVYGVPISQHAIALMLALSNKLPTYHSEQASRQWTGFLNPDERGHIELKGKTMFVVGLGGIGTEIARLGHGLGMRVVATRRSSRMGPDFVDYVGLSHELLDLAKQANVVINALPYTKETIGIFDREFFDALPESALFVNIGRGESVNQEDLIVALESGRLAGAGLDVTDPEPLPDGHKLWSTPNVILTPHVANSSDLNIWRADVIAWENLRRYVEGARILNVVDLEAGY